MDSFSDRNSYPISKKLPIMISKIDEGSWQTIKYLGTYKWTG